MRQPDIILIGGSVRLFSINVLCYDWQMTPDAIEGFLKDIGAEVRSLGEKQYVEQRDLERKFRKWWNLPHDRKSMRTDEQVYAGVRRQQLRRTLRNSMKKAMRRYSDDRRKRTPD